MSIVTFWNDSREQTGKTLKTIEKDTDRDNYMTAEEAKKYGLVDKIFVKRSNENK